MRKILGEKQLSVLPEQILSASPDPDDAQAARSVTKDLQSSINLHRSKKAGIKLFM